MSANQHPSIVALAFSEAGMFMRTPDAARVQAIISIHGQHEFGIENTAPHRLDLSFDDIEAPDPTDILACYHATMRRRAAEENGLYRIPPTRADVEKIIIFAHEIQPCDGILLCHCSGGVSRSPAAALLCLAVWLGPGHEIECARHIQAIRPCAFPHPDMIRMGDEILQRHGQLIAALANVPLNENST